MSIKKSKTHVPTWWIMVQILSLSFLSVCGIAININEALLLILVFLFILAIPCLLISLVSLFCNIRFNTPWKRVFVVWNLANIILLLCPLLSSMHCTAFSMEENYERNKDKFAVLDDYLSQTFSPDISLHYDFLHEETWNLLAGKLNEESTERHSQNGAIPDVMFLTNEVLKELKSKIKDVNCMGIEKYSGEEYYTLTFVQQGLGIYSYRIYYAPITQNHMDSLRREPNLIPYSDTIAFEYGCGAIGSNHFPRKEEY
ncbi:MAG: hypothetical protein LUD17_04370 [Bacteroidales bacterium]|nr:hypothetical protein [Bacteroidales bacterium]